jgi:hypothetical protein
MWLFGLHRAVGGSSRGFGERQTSFVGECKDVAGKLAGREWRFGIGFGTLADSTRVEAFVHWLAGLKEWDCLLRH